VPGRRRWARRLAWAAGGGVLAFATLLGIAHHALPPLLRGVIAEQAGKFLGREVQIDAVALDPLRLSLAIDGLRILEPGSAPPLLEIERVEVDLAASSLWHRAPVLERVRLKRPHGRVVRTAPARFNFSDIVETLARRPRPERPAPFSVRNLSLVDGRIDIDDRVDAVRHELAALDVSVPLLSRLPSEIETPVQARLAATLDGAPFSLGIDGRLLAPPLAFTTRLAVKDLAIARWLPHAPLDPVPALSGKLSTDLRLAIAAQPDGAPASLALSGSIEASDLAIADARGTAVAQVARLAVGIEDADLRARRVALSELSVAGLSAEIVREADGRLNLLALLPRQRAVRGAVPDGAAPETPRADATSSGTATPARAAPSLSIASLRIEDGRIGWTDRAVSPTFATRVDTLAVSVQDFATGREAPAPTKASLRTARGEALELEAGLRLAPLFAEGRLTIADVRIPDYAPYFAARLPTRLEAATVSGSSGFRVDATGGKPALSLAGLALDLRGVRARLPEAAEPWLQLASLAVAGVDADLAARRIRVGSIRARDGSVRAMRDVDGLIDLARLGRAPATASAASSARAPTEPWSWSLGEADLDRWAVRVEDRRPPDPVIHEFAGLSARIAGLGSRPGTRGRLQARTAIARGGSLALKGEVGLAPGFAEIEVDLDALALVPLQPYFSDRLNVQVTSGDLGVRGRVRVEAPPASQPARVRFEGDLRLASLGALERSSQEELLRIGTLQATGVRAGSDPAGLDIAEIALSDFAARLILSKEGRLSLREVIPPAPGAKAAAAAKPATPADPASSAFPTDAEAPTPAPQAPTRVARPDPGPEATRAARLPMRIGRITIVGGTVNYSDFFVRPNYRVNLTGLAGTVTELTSQPGTTAEIDLRAAVDGTAPVQIAGRINPLASALFVDIKASMRGAELSTLSPYTIKYTGYGIERGRLTLETAYRVEDRKLDANHRVFLDQLTFSADRVDGPAVLRLPILFAVRLLQNRNGEIDLTLPVSGTLDDPKFRLGPIIWQVVVNLITRIVTAPFALFSGGGQQDLSYVGFPAGSTELDEAGRSRLASVGKGMAERPSLRLELSGRVDPEADRAALRLAKVQAAVRAQVARDRVRRGEAAPPLAQLVPTREEYETALRAVYRQAPIARPRNAIGLTRDLPVAEMETLLLTASRVGDEDLHALATERARAVEAWLVGDAGLSPERIFRVPAKDDAPSTGSPRSAARVDLLLR
jgi:hypothetical protein